MGKQKKTAKGTPKQEEPIKRWLVRMENGTDEAIVEAENPTDAVFEACEVFEVDENGKPLPC